MRERLFLAASLVVGIFSSCGYCSVVAEVDWHQGEEPPSETWIIWPSEPTSDEVINFSGPTIRAGSPCAASEYYGGWPTITIDEYNRTIELWFEPPPGGLCAPIIVCGLEGRFGPLAEGEWLFFGDHDELRLHIRFEVSVGPLVKLEDPNGGESLVAGSLHEVRWQDLRTPGTCPGVYVIEYSTDNGHTWITEFTVGGRCSYWWSVPEVDSDECLVRVSDISYPGRGDRSDETFTIYQCTKQLPGDQNTDCYVNGYDYALVAWWWRFGLSDMHELAALADSWLMCGDPFDPGCVE